MHERSVGNTATLTRSEMRWSKRQADQTPDSEQSLSLSLSVCNQLSKGGDMPLSYSRSRFFVSWTQASEITETFLRFTFDVCWSGKRWLYSVANAIYVDFLRHEVCDVSILGKRLYTLKPWQYKCWLKTYIHRIVHTCIRTCFNTTHLLSFIERRVYKILKLKRYIDGNVRIIKDFSYNEHFVK